MISGRLGRAGTVEVDETYIGGEEPELPGGRAKGKKALVGVAVEVKEPRGYGRCRMTIISDGSAASLHPFVTGNVEPGTTVVTDGWQGYAGIGKLGYLHERRSQRAARARGEDPAGCCPACTESLRWRSGGCLAFIRAALMTVISRATSTSSCSGSTGARPEAAGWSSTACLSSLSPTTRCAIATWSSTRGPRRGHLRHPGSGAIHRAWSARRHADRGDRPDLG